MLLMNYDIRYMSDIYATETGIIKTFPHKEDEDPKESGLYLGSLYGELEVGKHSPAETPPDRKEPNLANMTNKAWKYYKKKYLIHHYMWDYCGIR